MTVHSPSKAYDATSSMTAGARLDRLPLSAFHWRLLALIGGGLFLDGFDIYLTGGVLGSLVKSEWSTLARNATFISVTFGGMVVGGWMAGVLGDRFGRRSTYQVNLLIMGLASLAGAAAPSMNWLIAARFFMGLGMGAEIVVGYVTLSEFIPPKQRGRWGAGLMVITNTSMLVSSLCGFLIIPNFGWRWMFIIVGVGALIVWYLRKNMPESPRWLELKGRLEDADVVLGRIEAQVALTHALPAVMPSPQVVVIRRSVMNLLSKDLIPRTIVGAVLMIVQNTVLYGFVSWIPSILVKQGVSVTNSLAFMALMAIGAPLGTLIPSLIADRLGRKRGIIYFSILAMILGAIYPNVQAPMLVALAGFGVVLSVTALFGFSLALYIPEMFPTDLRMRGSGFCNTAGRLATVGTPYLILTIYNQYDLSGVVALMVALLGIQAVVVGLFGIETKSKSLEELSLSTGEVPADA
jgi:MFS transporter, putative metabolite:H+ symporter